MLLSKRKITEDLVDMLMKWRHSGFNVFCGPRIQPGDEEVIKKILKHFGLWEIKERRPPKATGPPKIQEYKIDFSISQLTGYDKWLYVDPVYPEIYPP